MKTRVTTLMACMLLAVTGIQAQKSTLVDAFNKLLTGKKVQYTSFSSHGVDADAWQCSRYDFLMPATVGTVGNGLTAFPTPNERNKKLIDGVIAAYKAECNAGDVSYAYLSEQSPLFEAKEHISFSIPYSDSEAPLIIGSKKSSSVLVVTKSLTEPTRSLIYAMEWDYVFKNNRASCEGSIYIVQTDKKVVDVRRSIDEKRAVASQFQSELLRKLVFYRDKLKEEKNIYNDRSAHVMGVGMAAYSIAVGKNPDEIEQAIPLVVEIFAYIERDNEKEKNMNLLLEALKFLNDALSELKNASDGASIPEVAGQ